MIPTARQLISQRVLKNIDRVNEWIKAESTSAPPPFYSSIDLRDAGFKISGIDCNLFPAGFNNICPKDLTAAPPIAKAELEKLAGKSNLSKIALVPEKNTKNKFYVENLWYLKDIFERAGYEVKVAWTNEDGGETPQQLESMSGKLIKVAAMSVSDSGVSMDSFDPDVIVLNNDFSSGYPKALDQANVPVIPSHKLGWHSRKKSVHFEHFNALAKSFCEVIDVDPWLIQVDTRMATDVDFDDEKSVAEIEDLVSSLLNQTHQKYKEHSIEKEPVAFIKSNMGTYGMGIMTIKDPSEIKTLNRRAKNKMAVGKNRIKIDSVIIQEGVPTSLIVDELPAEPVIYLMGPELIGGFLRANSERTANDNLNSKGMVFKTLCVSDLAELLSKQEREAECLESRGLELVYGTIARISALAAGREISSS